MQTSVQVIQGIFIFIFQTPTTCLNRRTAFSLLIILNFLEIITADMQWPVALLVSIHFFRVR